MVVLTGFSIAQRDGLCNMYIEGEYGGGTGWVFRGDAKLAHSAVWLGCVCGRTGLLFWGDAELAHSAIPLDVFVSLWVE